MFKEIFLSNIPASIATIGLIVYFMGMFLTFGLAPLKFCEKFAIRPVGKAGKTEIRVYYGGISFALGFFLGYLFLQGYPEFGLVGGLIFANIVFFSRLIFTFIDKGWKEPYTKLALPAEGLFIIALWICFIISKIIY